MPKIIITANALKNLVRLKQFLEEKNSNAAKRIAPELKKAIQRLSHSPESGRIEGDKRILVASFGRFCYLIAYKYLKDEAVYILAIRHGREADWK